jgi:hypothetical protein
MGNDIQDHESDLDSLQRLPADEDADSGQPTCATTGVWERLEPIAPAPTPSGPTS